MRHDSNIIFDPLSIISHILDRSQPTLAYFGQKDIQQALILRRLVSDLLFTYPASSSHVRVLPTTRDEKDDLALSSRNAYLSQKARGQADVLIQALKLCEKTWKEGSNDRNKKQFIQDVLKIGRDFVERRIVELKELGLELELDYITLNEPIGLKNVENLKDEEIDLEKGLILSGAVFIRDLEEKDGKKVRLIDNFLLGLELK